MVPLYQLGRARWNFLLARDEAAEMSLESGLLTSEEVP